MKKEVCKNRRLDIKITSHDGLELTSSGHQMYKKYTMHTECILIVHQHCNEHCFVSALSKHQPLSPQSQSAHAAYAPQAAGKTAVIWWAVMFGVSGNGVHNYIDLTNRIIRKGAISAQAGERVLIPINMRDGSLICIGRGNPDWNFSAPHGAGRLMSRTQAHEHLNLADFQAQMQGIYTTCVCSETLDESPMAYKSKAEILAWIVDSVEVEHELVPLYNFKAV